MSKDTKGHHRDDRGDGSSTGLLINRISNVGSEVRAVGEELSGRTDRLDDDLSGRSERLDEEMGGRIERLRSEMLANYHRLDEQLRSVEQGFERIDQRLEMLERAVIPAAEPAQ